MTCRAVREAVSALLDGEEAPLPADDVERHLEGCPGCRRWYADAMEFTRFIRVTSADDVPDLTGVILAAADPRAPRRRRAAWRAWRTGLVVVATAQVLFGVAHFGRGAGEATHAAHEVGAWDLALAAGFVVVAARPARAWGMVPLVGAVVATLMAGSVIDLAGGQAVPLREATHLIEVAGLVLVWLVARGTGPGRGVPAAGGGGLGGDQPEFGAAARAQPASRSSTGGVAGRVA